ncbi:transposase [Streptomyces sp. JV178]|uniref:transposase n=1 Tax=Streptomyces sp. JV178 TaxID=858632 RepID=UPI00211E0C3B|nr:transposase [Streptomyces sp. JV178]
MITTADNPERLDSKASFRALCVASPIEHSSGQERCWRLTAGGDRQATAALHRIVYARLRFAPRCRRPRRCSALRPAALASELMGGGFRAPAVLRWAPRLGGAGVQWVGP